MQLGKASSHGYRWLDRISVRSVFGLKWSKTIGVLLVLVISTTIYFHKHMFTLESPHHTDLHSSTPVVIHKGKHKTVPTWSDNNAFRQPNAAKARQKVIVLSYMRSGSTLCGDILQAHPEVFYVYEPLLYLWDYNVPQKDVRGVSIRRRAKQHWRDNKPFLPEPLTFLTYMFNCNITRYNIEFLTNVVHSNDFRVDGCFPTLKNKNIIANVSERCREMVQQRCDQSTAVVQKVVRLSMREANEYLAQDPGVRLIHLIRDPRGILLSRMRFNKKVVGEMHNNYKSVCDRIWEDIVASKEVVSRHPGRVLTIRYEDLAQHPQVVTSAMYDFLGLQLLPSVKEYVRTITSSEATLVNGNPSPKKTSRRNPYKTAYHWRLDLPFPLVKAVDQACESVLDAMGYLTFSDETELRNLDIPAKIDLNSADTFNAAKLFL